ncbi:MAG: hypothetical protein LBB46_05260, partial [Coriobacteriaceae bacterium]|nr:hypothetical protein [Coriobacteriaceae bacterium]
ARATSVYVTPDIDQEEARLFDELDQGVSGYFPFMQQFWKAIGPRGNTTFFDRGWYMASIQRMLFALLGDDFGKEGGKLGKKRQEKLDALIEASLQSAQDFEHQLINDGYVVVKFFLHISEEEQKLRLTGLYNDPTTRWRVSREKLLRAGSYQQAYRLYDTLLEKSNETYAPWVLVNGEDRRAANLTICATLVEALEGAFDVRAAGGEDGAAGPGGPGAAGGPQKQASPAAAWANIPFCLDKEGKRVSCAPRFPQAPVTPSLEAVDRSLRLSPADYKARLKEQQEKLYRLELEMFLKRIPLIVLFEGWDAAGKGGAIKRVAQALDARSYTIFPSAAPTPLEKLHPHLWRYWTRLPKAGHVGIYDRSWYGRVLVERVEGFATEAEWTCAFDEINGFEHELVGWGALLVKFWVEISPDEQLRRFRDREADPHKQWKITEEDWRNREKHAPYKAALDDMFQRTSTTFAPWTILPSEDKYYARVEALRTITDALEARISGGRFG